MKNLEFHKVSKTNNIIEKFTIEDLNVYDHNINKPN